MRFPTIVGSEFLTLISTFLLLWDKSYGREKGWTKKLFPDIRGSVSWTQCAEELPIKQRNLFICDPDRVLRNSEVLMINERLRKIINETRCHCQRKSQCEIKTAEGHKISVGFVVSVAIANGLKLKQHSPSPKMLKEKGARFADVVRSRWALGDCGNSALIFIWIDKKQVFISRGRLTKKYLTDPEVENYGVGVQELINHRKYAEAILSLLDRVEMEMNGEPEWRVDTGTLSLVISVALAVALVCIITGCVCAFRCCGNLRPHPDTRVGRALVRVDSLKAEVIRRGSQFRRSISRSPKFPHNPPSQKQISMSGLDRDDTTTVFGYDHHYKGPYEGTSMV